jgi:hypothetical protein
MPPPLWRDFRVGRQTGNVDELFRNGDCLFVERRDPHRKFIDESVKIGIGQRTVHVALDLRKIAVDIVGAQQNFQSTAAAHQAWKSRHQTVTRHQSSAHFPLRQNRIFAARKPHS